MKDTKFTPGTWRIMKHVSTGIESCNGRFVCTSGSYTDQTEKTNIENEYNALLIASAPELLEALQDANELLKHLLLAIPEGNVSKTVRNCMTINEHAINKALNQSK